MLKTLAGAGVLLLLLALNACGGDAEAEATFTASGTVVVVAPDTAFQVDADQCTMTAPRDMEVTIVAPDGSKVAQGVAAVVGKPDPVWEEMGLAGCSFDFSIEDIVEQEGVFTASFGEDSEDEFTTDEAGDINLGQMP
ncbi:MAG: hypothetical protein L0H74_05985 [Brachybacterium sp.]|nr:hypothetical protein [Brachybacterium sp.]